MQPLIHFLPDQASTIAGQVDSLYLLLVAVSVFFSLLIAALILVFAIRYRRRAPRAVGGSFDASLLLEITWSVIPLLIVIGIFFWGAKIFFGMSRPPADAVEYFVVGKQWMWKIQHPDGQREINELHVPLGVPIKLTMTSEDVIHSFYVPGLPREGRRPPGPLHDALVRGHPKRHLPSLLRRVLRRRALGDDRPGRRDGPGGVPGLARRRRHRRPDGGRRRAAVHPARLLTCHQSDATGRGPLLAGVFGNPVRLASGRTLTADEDYLRESILNPMAKVVAGYQPVMPTYQGQISEEGLMQLISYIKSQKAPPSAPVPPGDPAPAVTHPGAAQ